MTNPRSTKRTTLESNHLWPLGKRIYCSLNWHSDFWDQYYKTLDKPLESKKTCCFRLCKGTYTNEFYSNGSFFLFFLSVLNRYRKIVYIADTRDRMIIQKIFHVNIVQKRFCEYSVPQRRRQRRSAFFSNIIFFCSFVPICNRRYMLIFYMTSKRTVVSNNIFAYYPVEVTKMKTYNDSSFSVLICFVVNTKNAHNTPRLVTSIPETIMKMRVRVCVWSNHSGCICMLVCIFLFNERALSLSLAIFN